MCIGSCILAALMDYSWLSCGDSVSYLVLFTTLITNSDASLLRNKTCSLCLHSLVKTKGNVWEKSRAKQWKPWIQSRFSQFAQEFSQTLPRFSPGFEARRTFSCFIGHLLQKSLPWVRYTYTGAVLYTFLILFEVKMACCSVWVQSGGHLSRKCEAGFVLPD